MKYKAVVIGAGPAGIAVIGNLLEQHATPLLWVDECFQSGRLNKCYRQVPSNTKVKVFLTYAEGVSAFRTIARTSPEPNAISHLKRLDQEKTCTIAEAADMCLMLTEGLAKFDGVTTQPGSVTDASWTEDRDWTITVNAPCGNLPNQVSASAEILVLCTGSSPATLLLPTAPLKDISLDEGLNPVVLSQKLPYDAKTVMAVIGASHSAILVLMNLCSLASSSHPYLRIKWFARHPLRYAEERDGWILRDNTGLKGEVAKWAKAHLEEDMVPVSGVAKYLEKFDTTVEGENADYLAHLPDCTHVIQAIGFRRNQVPTLRVAGAALQGLKNNSTTGAIEDEHGNPIVGLYGAGIAWPEKVVDPLGNIEYAVGLAKFMRYLKRVVPAWVAAGDSPNDCLPTVQPDTSGDSQATDNSNTEKFDSRL